MAGTVGKTVVASARDRESNQISAAVVPSMTRRDLHEFAYDRLGDDADVFTDDLTSYKGLPNHNAVRHGVGEYVDEQAHVLPPRLFPAVATPSQQGNPVGGLQLASLRAQPRPRHADSAALTGSSGCITVPRPFVASGSEA